MLGPTAFACIKKDVGEFDFIISETTCDVDTVINGEIETTTTARPGDVVLQCAGGEYMVQDYVTFHRTQEVMKFDPETNSGTYKARPQDRLAVQYNGPETEIETNWGEMIIEPGDYIVGEFDLSHAWRVERGAFENTYEYEK